MSHESNETTRFYRPERRCGAIPQTKPSSYQLDSINPISPSNPDDQESVILRIKNNPSSKSEMGFYSSPFLTFLVLLALAWYFIYLPYKEQGAAITPSNMPVAPEELARLPVEVRAALATIEPKRLLTKADIQTAQAIASQQSALRGSGTSDGPK